MGKCDVLIIGGGLAATMAALKLADQMSVILVRKGTVEDGNSCKAQGGIAAALHKSDSPSLHELDTLIAGCHKNDRQMVNILVHEGKVRLKRWIGEGLPFDMAEDGDYSYGIEGAHRMRRILHSGGDRTGEKVMDYFGQRLKGRVRAYDSLTAAELLIDQGVCRGALFTGNQGSVKKIVARHTILATGGVGGLFQETSNDSLITGDGLAMAWRAGAALKDLEYIQFHPTLIYSNGKATGLASEALRGEGARLIDETGRQIMEGVHPLKDLAPRDVVARKLYEKVREGHDVYLDISRIHRFCQRFPQISRICRAQGIDLKQKVIPVRPGAHFHMGGVRTDENGRTTVPGLYAVGEAAGNGVHGANRLASNSLLEAVVFGERTGEYILSHPAPFHARKVSIKLQDIHDGGLTRLPGKEVIRRKVSSALGVCRNREDLQDFISWAEVYEFKSSSIDSSSLFNKEMIEQRSMLLSAWLIAKAALKNEHSCGAHFREDGKGRGVNEQVFAETTIS
ncbi:L-aspartate oxidase [Salipaludibacillus aurantiacus]|uniref:L-aspartate oxidase n=1 Tax=Salipaludibacillus aurantiacus TaxID=1601833 RepID=A0A1H9RPR6_9BACI|nr:L-aspartate oxidase [Salipaludibacillus aurantiacus]SER74624.1 L-aspartate oxidase [Salipaludibacillus aurantiacus]